MDIQTSQFYTENAELISSKYRSAGAGISLYFDQAFTPGCLVLDIGCGSGRDLNALINAKYDAYGVDSCKAFVKSMPVYYSETQGRVAHDSLPDLMTVKDKLFDGVLCSAVLMHLPEELLFDSVYSIRRVLKENGRLLISVPLGLSLNGNRDEEGRLFNGITPENFRLIFERIGFRLISRWDDDDSMGRPGRHWATLLFTLDSTDGVRSLDKIEGILNKDKKDATYKLALFRALAEIAMTSYNSVFWLLDGRVALPLKAISEKWLEYYWPIVESKEFIPQKRGEKPGCKKPIAFRKQLEVVIGCYQGQGGLSAFSVDYRNKVLPKDIQAHVSKLMSKLNTTIKDGPVYYCGGGGSTTFEYDKVHRSVLMDADIWREFSIMGHWISDVTILRWAELTAEISGNELSPSKIIDYLLVVPIPEREVSVARKVYSEMSDKVCVWSDKDITGRYDVDHAIPFSLWKNNDLWNLLPADSMINNKKRDKLPTHDLLVSRKDCIVDYWTRMRNSYTNRFDFEVEKFSGNLAIKTDNWENKLFASLAEAVEITAIQRGVERWEPPGVNAVTIAGLDENQPIVDYDKNSELEKVFSADIIEFPATKEKYVSYVPLYSLKATAGKFDLDQFCSSGNGENDCWVKVNNHRLGINMFVLKVIGHSMEPKIKDGDYCLFRAGDALGGSRHGRIVLAQHRSIIDPDTNARFTVKQYYSEKKYDELDNFVHVCIKLKPLNPDYDVIVIDHVLHDDELRIIAEFVSVL